MYKVFCVGLLLTVVFAIRDVNRQGRLPPGIRTMSVDEAANHEVLSN